MSTVELKEFLKAKIDEIENNSFLIYIKNILNNKIDDLIILTSKQKASIAKGQFEYSEGNFKNNDFVNEEIEKWLKE
ncbi:MAG: hypothetical protein H7195_02990 [Chryseobacterium sp.]|nr:hypothetical protein [Chryseobacterium sp.]